MDIGEVSEVLYVDDNFSWSETGWIVLGVLAVTILEDT